MPGRPLSEIVDPGWADALAPVADDIARMGDFLRDEVAAGRGFTSANGVSNSNHRLAFTSAASSLSI